MCGIAGSVGDTSSQKVTNMLKTLHHRGPDASRFERFGTTTLGMTRLAIIDVATGMQPVTDEAKTICVVFNGEIYNFEELRQDLLNGGHLFTSSGDSEVIAHLFERDGMDFVHLLRGMFAIAIWDQNSNELHLFRDRLGKKPLLYSHGKGEFLFASEARALLSAGVDRSPDLASIIEVAQFGYTNAPNTGFSAIKSVPPGSVLTYTQGEVKISRYWTPRSNLLNNLDEESALELLEDKLREAVRIRLVSERPLGSFLSGGIDSTLVTYYMTQLHSQRIDTFTIGFQDRRYDESRFASPIAKFLGTNHNELIVHPEPESWFNELSQVLDQPFADSSVLPTYLLSKYASKNIVVALGGDGGDEGFGGYRRYAAVPFLQHINLGLKILTPLHRALGFAANSTKNRNIKRLLNSLETAPSLSERYLRVMSLLYREDLQRLLPSIIGRNNYSREPILSVWPSDTNLSKANLLNRVDLETYLPGDLLYKADIASMANSIELRSPLLDHKIIEFGLSLPDNLRIRNGETKYLLRQLARNRVPKYLIDRPKMGFAIPRAQWLRTDLAPLAREMLTGNITKQRGWFDTDETIKIFDAHQQGRELDRIIWPLMIIEQWARTWLD